jgi:PmbA protein
MKYDILTVSEESLSIEVVGGKINSYRNKNVTKKGIRLFENGKIYTTSAVGDISDADLLKKAESTKTVGIPFEYQRPEFKNLEVIDELSLKDGLSTIEKAIFETQEGLKHLNNGFVFNGKFNRSFMTMTLSNEIGSTFKKQYGSNEWYYLFKQVGSANLLDGYLGEDGRSLNVKDVLAKNIPFIEAYPNEIKFKDGKYPVFFIDGSQLLGKLKESFVAEQYCLGAALYSGKLNQQILSPKFSLFDVNYSPEHSIYRKFDEEGTVRAMSDLPLIENGVMKNIVSNLRDAKKYGVEATGNGIRSFDSGVMTSFNRLMIGKGTRSTETILKDLPECIIVFMGDGGDFTDKGDFSTPLQLSYLMKNGKIVGRLPQMTVKTTTADMFGSRLLEIANDGFQKTQYQPSLFTEMDVYIN